MPLLKPLAVWIYVTAITFALLGGSGCTWTDGSPDRSSRNQRPKGVVEAPPVQRDAAIYAAVVEQLVTKDHTFGRRDPGFKVVYVLDGVVEHAEDPLAPARKRDPAKPFTDELKSELRSLTDPADLPRLEFVAERDSVIEGARSGTRPGHVQDRGVLISLGPIDGGDRRAKVGSALWINGLAGLWLTYVLEHRHGSWVVTGTTGSLTIS